MKSAVDIINKILLDHDTIIENVRGIQHTASDKSIIVELTGDGGIASTGFMMDGVEAFRDSLQKMSVRLNQHFNFEESGLLFAIQQQGDKNISGAFSALFMEHEVLRNQCSRLKEELSVPVNSELSEVVKTAQIKELQREITNFSDLLEAHAANEDKLLKELRDRFTK
jgi:hypothetical protein